MIRTPWALATWKQHHYDGFRPTPLLEHPATFVRTRGIPQGDVSSPHNWVSFFDIALRAVEYDQRDLGGTSSPDFIAAGPRGQLYSTGDISYGRRPGLHRGYPGRPPAESGYPFSLHRPLRHGALTSQTAACVFGSAPSDLGTTPELVTHGPLWAPTRVPVRTSGTIKMLGVTFDTAGPQRTQKVATKLRLAHYDVRTETARQRGHCGLGQLAHAGILHSTIHGLGGARHH